MDTGQLHIKRIPDRQCLVSQNRQYHDIPNQHGTYKRELLAGLYLLMGGIGVEVWV